jgi:hypothetical protein
MPELLRESQLRVHMFAVSVSLGSVVGNHLWPGNPDCHQLSTSRDQGFWTTIPVTDSRCSVVEE